MLLDDLNTPGFIAKIHELYTKANAGDKKMKSLFNSACRFLGLFNISKGEWEDFKKKAGYTKWEDYKKDEPIEEKHIWPAPQKLTQNS